MTTTLVDHAKGTAFAILYQPRAIPDSTQPPKKSGPKPKLRTVPTGPHLIRPENTAPGFNTPITSSAQSDRTSRIRGRGLL
jgi:hypothetical protein